MPVPETQTRVRRERPAGNGEILTRTWAGLGLAAVCGAALLHSRHVYAPCDDAYIFFVYAKNLIAGNGLTFNGEHVWGFTSTLWVSLVSGVGLLGFSIHAGAEVLSLLTGWFALWATYRLGRALSLNRLQSLLPPFLLALTGDFAFYIGNGLEQALFLGFTMLASALMIHERRFTPARIARISAIMAAAVLTRPEGVLLCGLLLLYWCVRVRRVAPPLLCGVLLALFVGPVHATVAAHYGEWVPNTWYAKSDMGISSIYYGARYFTEQFPRYLPILVTLGVAFLLRRFRHSARTLFDEEWMIGISLLWICYVILQGGDNLVGGRMLLPVVPFFHVVAVRLLRTVPVGRLTALSAFLGLLLAIGYQLDERVTRHAEGWRTAFRIRSAAGKYLRENYPRDTVVALSAAGVIPYTSGMRTIDMLGLNDRHIAREGRRDPTLRYGHQVGDGEYVLSRKPDVILFPALAYGPGSLVSDREIWESHRFHEEYVPVRWTGIGTAWVRRDRLRE